MERGDLVRHSKFGALTSEMGQKQTSGSVRMMSALPQKRTLPGDSWMSALCQKRTKCNATKRVLTAAALRSKIVTSGISAEPA
jgi:hypothetical protein